jgi:hypothetical protein
MIKNIRGSNPKPIWKKSKRKDFFNQEDYEPSEEEEDESGEDEEEEEDPEYITNIENKGKLLPYTIPLAVVRVVEPPKKMMLTTQMSTSGRLPRNFLASRNPVANLNRMEYMCVPTKDLIGEWDTNIPNKEERSCSSECKLSKEKAGKNSAKT